MTIPARAHANYYKVLNTHFISVKPGETYTKDIDKRKWFKFKRETNYKVAMSDQLRGFFEDAELEPEPIPRSSVYTLPRIPMEVAEVSINLVQNMQPPGIGQTVGCEGDRKLAVGQAKEGANELASFVDQYRDQSEREWIRFFNGDARIRDRVLIMFGNIFNYGRPLRAAPMLSGVRDCCAADNVAPCGEGVITYHQLQPAEDLLVVFCNEFFEKVEAKLTCEIPGPENPDMMDRTGWYLRALTWSQVGREFDKVRDGM